MYKKGFTLAEVLIVLGILGLIAAMTMSVLFKVLPNMDEENLKKTAYSVQNIIAQMHNDESMYPKISDYNKQGFKNTDKVNIKGVSYGGSSLDGNNEENLRNEKFCRLFASRFEKKGADNDVICLSPQYGSENVLTSDRGYTSVDKSFTTTDNMDWFLFKDDFKEGYSVIIVDVNGSECPNTTDLGNIPNNCNGRYKFADRRKFYIRPNGTFTDLKPGSEADITPYAINVNIICNGKDDQGNKIKDCGEVTINSPSGKFVNLELNETYTLTAIPKKSDGIDAFTSSWQDNKKDITINGQIQNIKTTVRFSPIEKHNINLVIEGCMENEILGNCIKSENFKLVQKSMWKVKPDNGRGYTSGNVLNTYSGRFTEDSSYNTLSTTDIPVGNYRLQFDLVWPYAAYDSGSHTITSSFVKDFRLGTSDISYTINLLKCEEVNVQKVGGGSTVTLKVCESEGNGYTSDDEEYVFNVGTQKFTYEDEEYEKIED